MTGYAEALTLKNGIQVINACERAVKESNTYQEALAQVEGIITAAWDGEHDYLSKGICSQLWIANHI